MLENVGRKVALIVVLLLVSLGLLVIPAEPFQLGLDLQGGTRLVYRFDFEEAKRNGQLGANEDPNEILASTVAILRTRVDPTGVLEPIIRTELPDKVIIELPGNVGQGSASATGALAVPLDRAALELAVQGVEGRFTPTGIVRIGKEEIRYGAVHEDRLLQLQRGHNGITEEHAQGEKVELISSDAIRSAIETLGELSFQLVAEPRDFTGKSTDLTQEGNKLQTWQAANPGALVSGFNDVPPDQGGPDPSIRWYPTRFGESTGAPMAVLVPTSPKITFRGEALVRIHESQDQLGYPAVGFEIRNDRIEDFADFTGDNVNRRMAIVLNEEVRSAPNLETKLVGGGIIEGKFKAEEVKNLITVLRSGSLKLKPKLDHDERVGPTLGDDYVKNGFTASLFSLVVVVAFMVLYYRRLGVFAALALLTNLVMFMGGMAALQATLTLPGIAGIVLTVGMAVDANILIFDRLREESEKGRNVKQAAKAGFEKALSAIVDANVTTFLTALILYKLGSGPVRGFAVTLMVGILTSVFAALVTTRVFVHWALSQGAEKFKMGRWMADAKYDFLGTAKVAITGSILVCVGGLAFFFTVPDDEKLGIDFTGGVEAQIQTAKSEPIDAVRALVGSIATAGIGKSAEVKPVQSSRQGEGFTQFRILFKTAAEDSAVAQGTSLQPVLREGLKAILLEDPVQFTLRDEGGTAKVEGKLFFDGVHPEADIQGRLASVGLGEASVTAGDRKGAYLVTATSTAGRNPDELATAVTAALASAGDSNGTEFKLADPIPAFSQVGPQVVGQLRDNALLALAVSLFITVIYIRVRFAEYSYGIAAMVALVHDVLVTLAALTIGNHFGIVNGEINLAMIAVFLTIIGYSVNDTIVIFDRVRENLPRSNKPLRDVLNESINETLSRTIMTSMTVFLAIVVQYVFTIGSGNVLESISFAMIFGTISGVYSTVYIANPVFLWLETRAGRGGGAQARAQKDEERKRAEARTEDAGEEGALPSGST